MRSLGWEGRRLDDRGAGEVVVQDSLAVGLEDRFGGHVVRWWLCVEVKEGGWSWMETLQRSRVSKCSMAAIDKCPHEQDEGVYVAMAVAV